MGARALLAGFSVLGAAVLAPVGAEPAQGAQPESSMVFYSGYDTAGINYGEDYAAYAFVHAQNNGEWPSWSGSQECSTERADDFPAGPDTLVGWSIGRNAPVFFLAEAPERHDEIDTIWLLDPGHLDKFNENGCDFDLARTPSAYLGDWLSGDQGRRLVILSGDLSEVDKRAGLTQVYLDEINGEQLRDQTHLCLIDKGEVSNHDNRLVQFFVPLTLGPAECPSQTTRLPLISYRGASGRDGAVVRLYESVFDRQPDATGFNFWVNDGRTTWDMAAFFVTSDEFRATYGTLTDDQFLIELYRNVLGRGPDEAGLQFWRQRMTDGQSRAQVVVYFSDSTEFRIQTQTS